MKSDESPFAPIDFCIFCEPAFCIVSYVVFYPYLSKAHEVKESEEACSNECALRPALAATRNLACDDYTCWKFAGQGIRRPTAETHPNRKSAATHSPYKNSPRTIYRHTLLAGVFMLYCSRAKICCACPHLQIYHHRSCRLILPLSPTRRKCCLPYRLLRFHRP